MKELDKGELKNVLNSDEPVAIFYYMSSCPHCKVMHEPWDELESKHPNTKFCKVERSEIPEELGISAFPHFEKRSRKKVDKTAGGEMDANKLDKLLFASGGRRTRRRRARRLTRRGRKGRK